MLYVYGFEKSMKIQSKNSTMIFISEIYSRSMSNLTQMENVVETRNPVLWMKCGVGQAVECC
jgi:hypothetical protein